MMGARTNYSSSAAGKVTVLLSNFNLFSSLNMGLYCSFAIFQDGFVIASSPLIVAEVSTGYLYVVAELSIG